MRDIVKRLGKVEGQIAHNLTEWLDEFGSAGVGLAPMYQEMNVSVDELKRTIDLLYATIEHAEVS